MQTSHVPLSLKLKRIALLAVLAAGIVVMFMIGIVAIAVIVTVGAIYLLAVRVFGFRQGAEVRTQHFDTSTQQPTDYQPNASPADPKRPKVIDADFEVIDEDQK